MAYHVEIIKEGRAVFLRHYGETDVRDYESARDTIREIMNVNAIHKLLISMEDAIIKSIPAEIFRFLTTLKIKVLHITRIAVIAPTDSNYVKRYRDAENFTLFEDISICFFPDYDSAVAWLLR